MFQFFFSYSRDNNDEYLRQFFADLKGAVFDRGGSKDCGFIDQEQNEPGVVWEPKLEQGLATSRVFVAAVTANYATKPYCGKEWAAFEDRERRYAAAAGLAQPPGLLMPLLWVPRADGFEMPEAIQRRHWHIGNPAAEVNTKGLRRLVKLRNLMAQDYEEVLDALAKRILELSRKHAGIDAQAQVPALAGLAPAFGDKGAAAVPGQAPPGGPRRVHFVYGAPAPLDAIQAGRANVACYGNAGGAEWQPFYPNERTIGAIAQNVASSDALNMVSEELKLTANLADRVRELEAQRQLVVLLLDRWEARVPTAGAALKQFDQQNYINCSVLLPRNVGDAETAASDALLQQALRQVLHHRTSGGNPLLLRAAIDSEDKLRSELQDVLTRLRNEVIAMSMPEGSSLPTSHARPAISAHGAAAPASGG